MKRETAIDLLKNLLERASSTGEKTFLTSLEIAALRIVLSADDFGSEITEAIPSPPHLLRPERLIEAPIVAANEIAADMMLCIDFGTAFSKAFACLDTKETIPQIIDLPIGQYGQSERPLITPSEMILDNNMIYFGGAARKLFDNTEASPDRLIDSFKQYMTLGADVSNLSKIRIDSTKDPEQKFFQRDILLLYLAHLTRLTENSLEEKGISPNLRRRFAHPAWSDKHRKNNEQEMKFMMAEAIVLARSLGDQLINALPVSTARVALDQLRELKGQLPLALIAEPVREATAAGAGALLAASENRRESYVIVDIGAGTTDVAGCYCVNNPDWSRPRVFEVESAADAIKSAGNVLDNALTKLILTKSNVIPGSAEYSVAAASLSRSKRIYKETLFDNGQVLAELPTGEIVEVNLEEFLLFEPVVGFTESVKNLVAKTAIQIAGDAKRLIFVATGGGARLPIIKKIAEEGVERDGTHITFIWREPAPEGMAAAYPDLVDPYPQLAVAVGGALPALPEQRAGVRSGLSEAPRYAMAPAYKS
jgi:molecular chaperone DnaK (HSP70)